MSTSSSKKIALISALMLGVSACGGGGSSGNPTATVPQTTNQNGNLLLYPLSGSGPFPTTTTPSGVVGEQNENLTFTASGQKTALLVFESGYTGAFTVASSCQTPTVASGATGVATAAFASTATSDGPGAVLTVTAGATGGTCTFTISDASKNSVTVFVGNTITNGSVS